jgi:hypothetical protein
MRMTARAARDLVLPEGLEVFDATEHRDAEPMATLGVGQCDQHDTPEQPKWNPDCVRCRALQRRAVELMAGIPA